MTPSASLMKTNEHTFKEKFHISNLWKKADKIRASKFACLMVVIDFKTGDK